jgi:hypothetical protein
MTLRIETTSEGSMTVVSAAGGLEGLAVSELLKTCGSIESEIVLDLTGLYSIGPEGITAIRELVGGGAKLRGASPFIRLLLDKQQGGKQC